MFICFHFTQTLISFTFNVNVTFFCNCLSPLFWFHQPVRFETFSVPFLLGLSLFSSFFIYLFIHLFPIFLLILISHVLNPISLFSNISKIFILFHFHTSRYLFSIIFSFLSLFYFFLARFAFISTGTFFEVDLFLLCIVYSNRQIFKLFFHSFFRIIFL